MLLRGIANDITLRDLYLFGAPAICDRILAEGKHIDSVLATD